MRVDQFIIKEKYKLLGKIEEWAKLMKENVIAGEIEIGYGSYDCTEQIRAIN